VGRVEVANLLGLMVKTLLLLLLLLLLLFRAVPNYRAVRVCTKSNVRYL